MWKTTPLSLSLSLSLSLALSFSLSLSRSISYSLLFSLSLLFALVLSLSFSLSLALSLIHSRSLSLSLSLSLLFALILSLSLSLTCSQSCEPVYRWWLRIHWVLYRVLWVNTLLFPQALTCRFWPACVPDDALIITDHAQCLRNGPFPAGPRPCIFRSLRFMLLSRSLTLRDRISTPLLFARPLSE